MRDAWARSAVEGAVAMVTDRLARGQGADRGVIGGRAAMQPKWPDTAGPNIPHAVCRAQTDSFYAGRCSRAVT